MRPHKPGATLTLVPFLQTNDINNSARTLRSANLSCYTVPWRRSCSTLPSRNSPVIPRSCPTSLSPLTARMTPSSRTQLWMRTYLLVIRRDEYQNLRVRVCLERYQTKRLIKHLYCDAKPHIRPFLLHNDVYLPTLFHDVLWREIPHIPLLKENIKVPTTIPTQLGIRRSVPVASTAFITHPPKAPHAFPLSTLYRP